VSTIGHEERGSESASPDGSAPEPTRRHFLVLPGREEAEAAAAEAGARFALAGAVEIVREALAGEDDAEDAQWLAVIDDPDGRLDAGALDALAAEFEGWHEPED
jgi:hypothetical protein